MFTIVCGMMPVHLSVMLKPMKSIVMLSQKGGSGKTTLAVHLATEAVRDQRKVLLVDTDPQRSAEVWHECRKEPYPVLASVQAGEIDDVLEAARGESMDLAVVDTMPHTSAASSLAAAKADLILIPCQPTPFDIAAVGSSIEIAKARQKRCVVILNRAPLRAPEIAEARKALDAYNVAVYPHEITDRRTYFRAVTQGLSVTEFEPQSAASKEIITLWHWIKEIL